MILNLVRRLPRPLRAPIRVAGVHTGKHRGPRAVQGTLVAQRFVNCPTCEVSTAATVHGDVIRCAEGHLVQGVSA
ncbi:hypothetical protein [Streptomyces mirabilis]|uniref:hypothetical protein n=1 Tax=Streptomyces mirabilis TaxID=68239 RepID=UPI0033EBD1BC